jgi:hypothetical protein
LADRKEAYYLSRKVYSLNNSIPYNNKNWIIGEDRSYDYFLDNTYSSYYDEQKDRVETELRYI